MWQPHHYVTGKSVCNGLLNYLSERRSQNPGTEYGWHIPFSPILAWACDVSLQDA